MKIKLLALSLLLTASSVTRAEIRVQDTLWIADLNQDRSSNLNLAPGTPVRLHIHPADLRVLL